MEGPFQLGVSRNLLGTFKDERVSLYVGSEEGCYRQRRGLRRRPRGQEEDGTRQEVEPQCQPGGTRGWRKARGRSLEASGPKGRVSICAAEASSPACTQCTCSHISLPVERKPRRNRSSFLSKRQAQVSPKCFFTARGCYEFLVATRASSEVQDDGSLPESDRAGSEDHRMQRQQMCCHTVSFSGRREGTAHRGEQGCTAGV